MFSRGVFLKRILVIKLRPLGDCVLAGTCFEAIREAFPRAFITALVQPPMHELYRRSGWANEVMAYHRGWVDRGSLLSRWWKGHKLVSALRKRRYDLGIDLSASHRSAMFLKESGATVKVGLGLPGLKGLYDLSARAEDENLVPAVELDRRILALVGVEPKPHGRKEGWWKVPAEAHQYADIFWRAHKFGKDDLALGVNPFASIRTKEWYPEKWAEVIRESLANGLKVFFTCAPLERKDLAPIERALGKSLPIYSGRELTPLAGLYHRAAAVLSTDSGPRHLAASVGTPTLTVWGSESVSRWHPYPMDRHPVVLREVPCRPCGLSVCVEKKHECLASLEPSLVIRELKGLLKRTAVS